MKTLIVAFAILGAIPALAQNSLTTTQNPPAGNSSQSMPEPANSLSKASGTEKPTQQPGSAVGGTTSTQPLATAPSNSEGTSTAIPPVTR